MPRNRVLEVSDEAENAPVLCPLSHRVARRVGEAIIVALCIAIIVVFAVILRQGA